MRRWRILITAFYTLVVIFLLIPLVSVISGNSAPTLSWQNLFTDSDAYLLWIWIGALVGGQALLVVLSVDQSTRSLSVLTLK